MAHLRARISVWHHLTLRNGTNKARNIAVVVLGLMAMKDIRILDVAYVNVDVI